MREIKFKSYVKKEGKIESIIWCPFNEDRSSPDFDAPVKGDLLAYGLQFTGLKDKNGKEIYEGDIVKIIQCECIGQSGDGSEEEWISCEGDVFFEDAMFVFEGNSAGPLPLYAYKDDLEVIGNIFVTP